MKNGKEKLQSYGRVATAVAILIVLSFVITPVSASTCHPGFVKITPSYSFQYSQPSFSSVIGTSPGLNQGSAIQFTRPTFTSTAPDFTSNGKGYTSFNPFRW